MHLDSDDDCLASLYEFLSYLRTGMGIFILFVIDSIGVGMPNIT